MYYKHGMTGTRLYRIWQGMKQRCNNPNKQGYGDYGGKGIKVCEEWENSFETFYDWATGNGYSDTLTIDRKDSSGNYEPSNCRWLTLEENSGRSRKGRKGNNHENGGGNKRLIEYRGRKQSIAAWSRELGISYPTLYKRLIIQKWSIEKAFNTEVVIGGIK